MARVAASTDSENRHEIEHALARRARAGCTEALGELVRRNLGFVHWIARDYRHYGLDFEDLVGEGHVGLVEAARRFDADRGVRFTTYASWWVRKSIRLALDAARWAPRPDRRRAGATKGWEPGVRVHRLGEPQRPGQDLALEARVTDPAPGADERLLAEESTRRVQDAVARLAPTERRVVVQRFGLDGAPARSLQQAGREMGVSGERIRQIEGRALDRLRRTLLGPLRVSPRGASRLAASGEPLQWATCRVTLASPDP